LDVVVFLTAWCKGEAVFVCLEVCLFDDDDEGRVVKSVAAGELF